MDTPFSYLTKMIRFPKQTTDEQIFDLIREWVEVLAQERYDDAFQMVRHSQDNHWSPQLIQTVIENYGSIEPRKDGAKFRVTSISSNPVGNPIYEIEWYVDDPNKPQEYVGEVAFDLPLNEKWSDLTVVFHIVEVDSELTLELDDIHVF
jgi:hypothetical protein